MNRLPATALAMILVLVGSGTFPARRPRKRRRTRPRHGAAPGPARRILRAAPDQYRDRETQAVGKTRSAREGSAGDQHALTAG